MPPPASAFPAGRIGVKICGVNTPASFDAAHAAGADWVGFQFFARSPRYVVPHQAAALSARLEGGPARVGLFVEPDDEDIEDVLDTLRLDALQLYAPAERVRDIRARFGVPVWRAVGIAASGDLPTDAQGADALVIEPRPAPDATRPGGNGTRLDWAITARWRSPAPWLLAGGLTPANLAAAIAASGAAAVDVSSGVETAPGVKDPALIAAFVAAARG